MSDYSRTDRILHYLALGHPFFGELIFDIEKTIFGSHTKTRRAIYVTGLARAGTTALMRNLHATGHFASLTYNDMPFVLSPNLWAKISSISTKKRVMQERAHGDGIKVDFDTPEALEEIFWKLHCGSSYISEEALHTHTIDNETIRQLLIYQALICKRHDRPRYLAKNNNHILRLASIAPKTKETTHYLIAFRHPATQARSLLEQHKRFRDANRFTKKYMGWLAHHEFGATHKPFQFNVNAPIVGTPDEIDYWLQRWIDAYAYLLPLLEQKKSNLIPVSYERLCTEPEHWAEICRKVDISESQALFHNEKRPDFQAQTSALLDSAIAIYWKLDQLTRR